MGRESDVPYSVRNDIVALLNRSPHGFFLDETLRRGNPQHLKTANNNKLLKNLLNLLTAHPNTTIKILKPHDGGKERVYLVHTSKHFGQSLPVGWHCPEDDAKTNWAKPDDVPSNYAIEKVKPSIPPVSMPGSAWPVTDELSELDKQLGVGEVEQEHVHDEVDLSADLAPLSRAVTVTEVSNNNNPAIEKEKEIVQMTTAAPLSSDLRVRAAQIQAQLDDLNRQADEVEKQENASKILEDIRAVQLKIARHTTTISRLVGETADATEELEKAQEELRKLCAVR